MTRISIVVPCYNQAAFLDECLQSVLNQTFQKWECIIVNDGSPDNTEEIAKKWVDKDSRFKYVLKENGGPHSARNVGIRIASGEWILPLDGDDKIGEKYLELAEKEFKNGYVMLYCECEYFGEKTGRWKFREFSLDNLAKHNLFFCTTFFKKTDWQRVGGYDEKMTYGVEDYEFWISILKGEDSPKVKKIPYVGFYYRVKTSSRNVDFEKNKNHKKLICNYISLKHADFFIKHLGNFQEIYPAFESYYRIINHPYLRPVVCIAKKCLGGYRAIKSKLFQ